MGIKETIGKIVFNYVKKQLPDFKEFFLTKLEDAREDLVTLLKDNKIEEAEAKLVDDVLTKVKLPWFVKPFKGLLKNEILKQLRKIKEDVLERKLKEWIATK